MNSRIIESISGHGWFIIDSWVGESKYLWAKDLDWHKHDEISSSKEKDLFVKNYYYKTKEEAEATLERSHP